MIDHTRPDHCRNPLRTLGLMTFAVAASLATSARAETDEQLAMQLSNPVAALISVPFQFNGERNIGPARDGTRTLLNIQPVVPFSLNADWNIISRTIVPVVWQDDIFPGAGSQSGVGDVVQSVFFSPKAPTAGGLIWGAGPVFLIPTGSDDLLTTDKWGAGPTGVVITQQGPWTIGALANHIWSFAGDSSRADVNLTFLQPFVTYTTPHRNDVFAECGEYAMTGRAGNGRCRSIPASRKSCGSAASWCRWVPSRATGPTTRTAGPARLGLAVHLHVALSSLNRPTRPRHPRCTSPESVMRTLHCLHTLARAGAGLA